MSPHALSMRLPLIDKEDPYAIAENFVHFVVAHMDRYIEATPAETRKPGFSAIVTDVIGSLVRNFRKAQSGDPERYSRMSAQLARIYQNGIPVIPLSIHSEQKLIDGISDEFIADGISRKITKLPAGLVDQLEIYKAIKEQTKGPVIHDRRRVFGAGKVAFHINTDYCFGLVLDSDASTVSAMQELTDEGYILLNADSKSFDVTGFFEALSQLSNEDVAKVLTPWRERAKLDSLSREAGMQPRSNVDFEPGAPA